MAPNKRTLAVAERSRKGIVIALWDLVKLTKKKVIETRDNTEGVVSLSIPLDCKHLILQGGRPDWNITLWDMEKSKLLATMKASSDYYRSIAQSDFHPSDNSIVCITGDYAIKFFRISDNNFKSISVNLMKKEVQIYTCHAWLNDEYVIVGSESGEVLLFEYTGAYELKAVLATDTPGRKICCIAAYNKGFIVGCDQGTLNVFERSDETSEMYKLGKVFKIPSVDANIGSLSLSPSEDIVSIATVSNQIYTLSLSNSDILKPEDLSFEFLSSPVHGPGRTGKATITGLGICVRKPLIATCGVDRSIRVWNYLDRSMDLMKVFPNEPLCIAFHPGGLQVAVSYTDSLHLMNLLMTDIRVFKEYPLKACVDVKFSNGGHLLAACSHTTIYIYECYTGKLLHELHGQTIGAITSIFFSMDDLTLFASNATGSISRWNLRLGTKTSELINKNFNWRCITNSHEHNLIYGVGEAYTSAALEQMKELEEGGHSHSTSATHLIYNIEFPNDGPPGIKSEVDLGVRAGQCLISNNGKYLFVSTCQENVPGKIRVYKLPLMNNEWTELVCEGGPITHMAISLDDNFLFASSDDGCLSILNVKQEGRNMKREKDIQFSEEILVTKKDLEEKQAVMVELQKTVEELTLKNDYELNIKDIKFNEKLAEETQRYQADIAKNKIKYNELIAEKRVIESQYELRIKQIEKGFKQEIEEMEKSHNAKIKSESERYELLGRDRDELNAKWDKQNTLLIQSHENYIEEMTEAFEKKLAEESAKREVLVKEKNEINVMFTDTNTSIEADGDLEVEDLKEKYMAKLTNEKNLKLRLRGENVIMRKKYQTDKKVIQQQDDEIAAQQQKEKGRHETIKSLEKDIVGHLKEIREREDTIADKDKRIYDLKKKNQELEKFKFVLDYKIKELRRQIEPRQNEISDMRSQMKEMDLELQQYYVSNASLDLMIGELKLKMEGMQRELKEEDDLLLSASSLLNTFQDDLHDTVKHLLDYKQLKPSTVKLFKKYVQNGNKEPVSDLDIQKEYGRQRDYLEKSVEGLKRKLEKDALLHQADSAKLMRENAALTLEINSLRRELQATKVIRGVGGVISDDSVVIESNAMTTKKMSGSGSKKKLLSSSSVSSLRSNSHSLTEVEVQREIDIQRKEVIRLKQAINSLNATAKESVIPPIPLSKFANTAPARS